MTEALDWHHVEQWARAGWRVVVHEAADPARGGLHYACIQTPAGPLWFAWQDRLLCFAGFAAGADEFLEARDLAKDALAQRAHVVPADLVPPRGAVHVALQGTAFQCRTWRALLAIPAGQTVSYGQLAARMNRPRAARAVGTAVGRNPVALFVPCHRVVGARDAGGYRWGLGVKRALLEWERGFA
ncbi:MAG TPA: methylated-DNA--[protein]-cysteine S-methyltransferase [Chromatiales bacterium]|nr:methylated-DNA--[protein]-cysteine S-methyltransferase [Chromatiales bacterium]